MICWWLRRHIDSNFERHLLIFDLCQNKPAEVPTSVTGGIAVDAILRFVETGGAWQSGKHSPLVATVMRVLEWIVLGQAS